MMIKKITRENMLHLFNIKLAFTSEYLSNYFNCTFQCLRNNLKRIGYYSSFTHNAKYYTLASIPEFNSNGIWFYTDPEVGDIGFTKYKTATELLLNLVNSSESGLAEDQIKEIMKIRVFNQLKILTDQAKIERMKKGGKYYYFSRDKKISKGQHRQLNQLLHIKEQEENLRKAGKEIIETAASEDEIRVMRTNIDYLEKKCHEKQQKIRALTFRLHDIERSRDHWKERVKEIKLEVKSLQTEITGIKKTHQRESYDE